MSALETLILGEQPTATRRRVGRVIAGSGADYLVMIEASERGGDVLSAGDILVLGQAGALCVASVNATSVPAPASAEDVDEIWIAEVSLLGSLTDGIFSRGVLQAPSLGAAAWAADEDDLRAVYAPQAGYLPIGTLARHEGTEACVSASDLAAGFGVFGTSSTGKSCTLATLVRALLRRRVPVRPVLLDAHDEYARTFGRAARVLRPGAGFVPHWLLTFDELTWVLSLDGGALAADEVSLLTDAVPAARRRMLQRTGEDHAVPVNLDSPSPWRLTDAVSWLDKNVHVDKQRSPASYKRLRNRLIGAPTDSRLRAVFGAVAATDSLPQLLADVFGIGTQDDVPMTIVQLGKLELGLDRLVASVLCRLALAVAEGSGGRVPILMLAEDAERYAPKEEANRIAELSRQAMEGLARRGARVGAGLGVTSARPSLVSPRLIAELPTAFVHRLPSEDARRGLGAVLPEGGAAQIATAGTLGRQDCIMLGRAAPARGLVRVQTLPTAAWPRNERSGPVAGAARDGELVTRLISRWRYGDEAPLPVPFRETGGTVAPRRAVPAA